MILFELNARLDGKTLPELAEEHLEGLAALGFDWVWIMGIWRIGPAAVAISRRYGDDFEGSPYAIADYEVDPALGGEEGLRAFVASAHAKGLRVMVDFVPNHMAVDSPMLDAHPAYAIHSNLGLRHEQAADYFDHPKGRLAHGKDPYFPGWTDTVQLDYAFPPLRAHQIEVLKKIAGRADGVRCDMAMLVLREHVRQQWFPAVGQGDFDRAFPREFWSEAIEAVRAEHPGFVFMAEVYWDKEPYLQELGFDFTYDKKLYDRLAHGASPEELSSHVERLPEAYLRRSVHFLENHDEERAAVRFGARARPAAILSFAIPGAPFVHQGQRKGRTEKLPVQRRRRLRREDPDAGLERFYAELLAIIKDPLFREGALVPLGVQRGVVLFARRLGERCALVAVDPRGTTPSRSPALEFSGAWLAIRESDLVHGKDLWTGAAVHIGAGPDGLRLAEGAVPSWGDNHAFLLELSVDR